ncbi:MAG: DUF1684 domain-containing protein [Melioribacter sp.]|uniref:DUF1684 domain-containing protein n=1 Tax=Rosettibacter primus TaxID=3111523 RepID=UPI00247DF6EC|nr:DUF1684 domain-containing protein [Melioribacter sp.]
MRKKINMKYSLIAILFFLLFSCGQKYTEEEINYIKSIEEQRKIKNEYMKNDPASPFNYKGKVEFHELKYFDVDPKFVFKSKLYEYNPKDTITIYGTKGEARKAVRFGYVLINYENKEYKVNVYEGTTKSGEKYYSIWFTDKTTNKETYGVGRYLDFEKHNNPDYIYIIDFNLAYNPYCAYSPNYSCAIPTKEDFIPIEIKAGEKKFHN